MPDSRGLFEKYTLTNNETGEKVLTPYFIVKFTDPNAVAALSAYAKSCRDDHPVLADDLIMVCESISQNPSGSFYIND